MHAQQLLNLTHLIPYEKKGLNIAKTHGLEALKLSYKLQCYYNTDLY